MVADALAADIPVVEAPSWRPLPWLGRVSVVRVPVSGLVSAGPSLTLPPWAPSAPKSYKKRLRGKTECKKAIAFFISNNRMKQELKTNHKIFR